LDILTPKGQESKRQEDRAIALWYKVYPELRYCETPKDKPAAIDALIVKDDQIQAVVETKCRPQLNMTIFALEHKSRWLVTDEKIRKAQQIAEALQVPFVGFLYMPETDALFFETLWHPNKGWTVDIQVKETQTQATINGGKIVRKNAYIDMSRAKLIMGDDFEQPTTE
jgi:hypothetical protein